MKTITKKDLVSEIARRRKLDSKAVQSTVQEILNCMSDMLVAGKRLEFRDFGVFEIVRRQEKVGRNPKCPEVPIVIPPRRVVKFTSGKKLKELVSD